MKSPGYLLENAKLGAQNTTPLVCFQAAEHSWKSGMEKRRQHFPTFLIHFSTEHDGKEQKATADGRWSPPIRQLLVFFFLLCSLKKTFSAQWIFAHFPPVWARPGKSVVLGNSPRKSIRCGCCFGNETFHHRNGKRQRGKEHNFPMFFFPARFGWIRNYANGR